LAIARTCAWILSRRVIAGNDLKRCVVNHHNIDAILPRGQ